MLVLLAVLAIAVGASRVTTLAQTTSSLWTLTTTPGPEDSEVGSLELGVKFQSDVGGSITGLRFYKYAQNTGTHVGSLWSASGTLLGSVTFSNETASGWQQASFASPIQIAAATTYVASYHTNTGRYAATVSGLTAAVDAPPLHALASGASGGNGVYAQGASSVFPTQTWNASNYWVDVVFLSGGVDTTPPTISAVTPASGAIGVAPATTVTARFSEAMKAATISTMTVQLRDASNNTVAAAVAYNATTFTATLTPNVPLATSTTYTATVSGGASGVTDAAGNAMAADVTWSFTTGASSGPACPCSLWTLTTTPGPEDSEVNSLELGVKFQSDVSGYITALRFYKYPENGGTHVGSLWTASGTLLGRVTFVSESASGWQQAFVSSPIPIAANTTYVASYHTTAGRYAATTSGLTNAVNSAPLHALASGTSGGNGVYAPSATSVFPTQTYSATNYWVDAVFTTTLASDTTPPTVSGVSPTAGASGVSPTTTVTATFSETMNPATITTSTVQLRDSTNTAVPATVGYNAATQSAVLTPLATLNASTAYTATVKGGAGGVADPAGNVLPADVTWTFSTTNNFSSVLGQWTGVLSWPLVTLNATLLRTGEVLVWDGGQSVPDPPTNGGKAARLWNPTTQAFVSVPNNNTDLFCSSSCALPDGRIVVAGGADPTNDSFGVTDTNIFDPGTRKWTAAGKMANRRWYPTVTCLPSGNVLVTSGSQFSDFDWVTVPEMYNPSTNKWTQLTKAQASIPYYPHVFVLPDGRTLDTSSFQQPMVTDALNLTTLTRTTIDSQVLDGGSAVMYRPGVILKSGTAAFNNGSRNGAASTAYVLDMNQPTPAWRATASMNHPRSYHTLTVLPDGNVLVTGGGTTTDSTDTADAVYDAEMWSPATEAWTLLAKMQTPRLYHSIALLLPDGRVLVAGGGRNFRSNLKELNAEIYSPPYLFRGARPAVTSATTSVSYGSSISISTPDAASIGSVALIRLGSVTHGFNTEQRYLPLTFGQVAGGLSATAPANANLAPPGYYMLFIVNASGVPSTAVIINVHS